MTDTLIAPCRAVTPEEVAHYQELGWVKLKRFVDPAMLGKVLAIAKGIMGEDGDSNPPYGIDQPYFNAQYGGLYANPEIRPLHLGVGQAARALMARKSDPGVRLFNDFFGSASISRTRLRPCGVRARPAPPWAPTFHRLGWQGCRRPPCA